jgi:hypothetical protein
MKDEENKSTYFLFAKVSQGPGVLSRVTERHCSGRPVCRPSWRVVCCPMIVETLRCSVFPGVNRISQEPDAPAGRLYDSGTLDFENSVPDFHP